MSAEPMTHAEGWNIGSTTVKRVRLQGSGEPLVDILRHRGDVAGAARRLREEGGGEPRHAVVTGGFASPLADLPYLPEPICVEAALGALRVDADMVVSLGGEAFVLHCLHGGRVKRTVSARKCSAGAGEFLVQQLSRMGLDLDAGQDAAERGKSIPIASRCSVHTKSDATHKLNKGECSPGDVARSLVDILAGKAEELVDTASWPATRVVLSGGLTRVRLLVQRVRALLAASTVLVLEQSEYLEAYGAACLARDGATPRAALATTPAEPKSFGTHPPLSAHAGLVRRVIDPESSPIHGATPVILGVDAGSTATKAALVNVETGALVLGCSVRTHGNPVQATKSCIARLRRMLAGRTVRVVQISATGSGRQVVSMSLGNCDAFNEILAHARAARALHPDVDTVFEIGGQDAKFIRLRDGIPVDYAMNDGCSAGTGSFLEETAASDLNMALEQLAPLACRAAAPVDFGERCAAFINSEIRSALLSGRSKEDVAAGLIYAVVDNYVSKVVRSRQVGSVIVFQGGVALNEAAGLAIAGRTGSRVVIPPRPELMGCLGTALMSRDLLRDGKAPELDQDLDAFEAVSTGSKPSFVCNACERSCSVQRVTVGERTYPFGGLCSRWDEVRRRKRGRTGRNLVAVRHDLMLGEFGPVQPSAPIDTVGLPLALTTYELFPFYTRLLTGLGFKVVVSRTEDLDLRTQAAKCYPIEILHGAVADLLERGVAHVFLPYVGELEPNGRHESSYLCASAVTAPAVVRSYFGGDAARFLTPEINLSRRRRASTLQQIVELAARFGVDERTAGRAFREAIAHQERFRSKCRRIAAELLATAERPVIILLGRPYLAYARAVNLGIDQKIASHGYPVVPADMLPLEGAPSPHNHFHYTQEAAAAAAWASRNPGSYICHLSCFSCIPDAVFQHRLVRDLAGQAFCSLEIDSHTADAGLETRIEAFLAIVRERHGACAAHATPAREERRLVVARRGRAHVICSGDGTEYRLDDPRVKHVMLWVGPELSARLVEGLCTRLGWNVKAMGTTDNEILRLARSVCSGRECLSFRTIVGKMVKHLRERDPFEITVFHVLDKESACQNASWHDALPVLLEQMGATNAVCTFPTLRNGYLGFGARVGLYFATACIVGDILHEAGSTLRVLAADREHALEHLAEAQDRLVAASARGLRALEAELRRAADRLGRVPLAGSVSGAPKVLIAGGISRVYSEPRVREFLERRGILVKLEEIAEFLYHFVVQVEVTRPHFHQGYASPREQFAWRTVVTGLARSGLAEGIHTLKARVECAAIDALIRRWRGVFAASGLLFDRAVPLEELNFNSHHLISHNTFTEATTTLGRFLLATQGGVYDGVVNLGSFCCAETHISEALIEPHVNGSGMACATLAVEDVSLSAPDELKLETLAAQCWRVREGRPAPRRSPAAARQHEVLTTSLEAV